MAQCSEIETVLGMMVHRLDANAMVKRRTAGQLLSDARRLCPSCATNQWDDEFATIARAIKRRNRAAHSTVEIGSVYQSYGPGDGMWVPVISTMNGELCDERDLLEDLALQQDDS
jgi:hypothetical protein